MSKRTIVLIILDGWGVGRHDESNPIHVVNPQNLNYLKTSFPAGVLEASGISVGLPWGEEGNSEVGHLNLGAGRIIYQYFPRISLAIREGSFFKNPALKEAFEHAKKYNSSVNLIGLLSSGNVHSSLEHLEALIQFADKEKITKLNLHLFTDGRDSPPESALELINRLPQEKIASLAGRFYGMDREAHWERTQKSYDVLIGDGPMTENIEANLKSTYERNLSDEYLDPVLIGPQKRPIQDNDALIFFNFREDRMRQLTAAFVDKSFNHFPAKSFNNLYVSTMTEYEAALKVAVAYPPEKIEMPLARVLADNNKQQLRIAETQKYPHITYFFNGLKEEPFKDEYRILIPSRPIPRQDEHPEMMASEITTRLVESISEKVFDFILVNYANGDIIGHTGNYQAAIQAVKVIDEQIGKVTKAVLENDAIMIITSDHGNVERLFNPSTSEPETEHDISPVPVYLVAKEFERQKTEKEIAEVEKNNVGILADVSPTILQLMGLDKPKEMTGESFLEFLI